MPNILLAMTTALKIENENSRESGPLASAAAKNLQNLRKNAKNCTVDLDQVFISKAENIRDTKTGYSDESIGDMAAQIESVGGIIQPIGICKVTPSADNDNKSLMLIWGYRRAFGLKMLAETDPVWTKSVPALLVEAGVETTGATKVVQLMENLARKGINAMEAGIAIDEAMKDKDADFSQKDLAIMLGLSAPIISQYLKLLRLPKSIQEMISSGNLPFSHAREMITRVGETAWSNVAKKGASMTYGAFMEYLDKEYPVNDSEDGEVTTESTGEKTSSQKPAKMLRATDLVGKYVPFLKEQIDAADKSNKAFTAADIAQAKLDAVNTVLLNTETQLAKDAVPFIKKMEEKELEAKANEEAKTKEDKFFREQVKRIEQLLDVDVDPTKPDAPRPTLSATLAQVGKEIWALPATAPADKPETPNKAALGFALPAKPDDLVKKLLDTYSLVGKEREESRAKREASKAKKLADEKAKADAAGKEQPVTSA